MKEKVDSEIVRRYARGKYSFRDIKQLACWFEEVAYHHQLRSIVNSHWDDFSIAGQTVPKDLSAVFNNLKERILVEKKQLDFKGKFVKMYAKVAVVLLLPLLIYSSYSIVDHFFCQPDSCSWVEIVSPKGARTHLDLPDGTKVSLNSGTRLSYQLNFKNNRLVKLDGEAYFDVYHDASAPFMVQTDFIDVKDLGTRFSVSSYMEEELVEVILEEGEVELIGKTGSFSKIMKPDEGFYFDKETRTGKITSVEAQNLVAWKDGLLIFRSEPLSTVLKRIGRWYNVSFEVLDIEIEDFRYRATFHEEPIEEVLRLISLTAPIEYQIIEREIDGVGQYKEKVVIVSRKK